MPVMKKLLVGTLLGVFVSVANAATPPMAVTVSKGDKVVYTGSTNASGVFSTGKLEPGNYVVQLNARSAAAVKNEQFTLVVSAGKKKVSADAVAGEKFTAGGVAMRVPVVNGTNITGQVVSSKDAAAAQANSAVGSSSDKVRIINGKRHVWVGPETGSHIGGRWVEEGSVPPRQSRRGEGLEAAQDMAARVSLGDVGR
jgi:hypothetical protein